MIQGLAHPGHAIPAEAVEVDPGLTVHGHDPGSRDVGGGDGDSGGTSEPSGQIDDNAIARSVPSLGLSAATRLVRLVRRQCPAIVGCSHYLVRYGRSGGPCHPPEAATGGPRQGDRCDTHG